MLSAQAAKKQEHRTRQKSTVGLMKRGLPPSPNEGSQESHSARRGSSACRRPTQRLPEDVERRREEGAEEEAGKRNRRGDASGRSQNAAKGYAFAPSQSPQHTRVPVPRRMGARCGGWPVCIPCASRGKRNISSFLKNDFQKVYTCGESRETFTWCNMGSALALPPAGAPSHSGLVFPLFPNKFLPRRESCLSRPSLGLPLPPVCPLSCLSAMPCPAWVRR